MSEVFISGPAIEVIRAGVVDCLGADTSGHGVEHIDRVVRLTERFCRAIGAEAVRGDIAVAAALLHDVDDYKLVGGVEAAGRLANASSIMDEAGIAETDQAEVKSIITTMGYSKSLRGIRPTTIEGMLVSDADMCDAIGATGIVRGLSYTLSNKGSGTVFDRKIWPNVAIGAEEYNKGGTTHTTDGFINHFFEKLLKLRGMMMTQPGKEEAGRRDDEMVAFLRAFFRDENAPEWAGFLEEYLEKR